MKYKGDNEGYKNGALGKFDRRKTQSRPNVVGPTDPKRRRRRPGRCLTAAKYTSNDDAGLRDAGTDPENYPKVDIWDLAESQSDRTGPVRLRKRDQE